MKPAISLLALLAVSPALADGTREVDAHVHGVGKLNIAIDGTTVAKEFHAPGADIVGFEYKAQNDEDLAAIEAALQTLSDPLNLFGWPEAAECTVTSASAELETEEEHDDHGDDDHDDHDHDKEDDHGDHDEDHDDHDHDEEDNHDHAEHADHDDHDHAEEASHTEFHAEYRFDCANPDALTELSFTYFDVFDNALEVEVQIITASGASAFEVERDAPTLDLSSAF